MVILSILFALIIILLALALDFVIAAGLVSIICWAFGIAFSWKIALGIYCILLLISMYLKSKK